MAAVSGFGDRNVRRVLHAATRPRLRTRRGIRRLEPAPAGPGLEWVGFHTFRHTCASLLFEGGKNIRQVADWLGHSDPSFTLKTYVHLMDGGLGSADFLDAAVTIGSQDIRRRRRSRETVSNPSATIEREFAI